MSRRRGGVDTKYDEKIKKNNYEALEVKRSRQSQMPQDCLSIIKRQITDYYKKYQRTIGGSNTDVFQEFIKNRIYVDKTLLIKAVIDSADHLFISAPQRWGKSLNLSMLQAFFQPEIHQQENQSRRQSSSNQIKEFHIKEFFLNHNIGKEKFQKSNYVEEFQGKHPVVYLNFKGVQGNIESELEYAVRYAFEQHTYLLEDYKEQDDQHQMFTSYLFRHGIYIKGNTEIITPISKAVSFLCKLLFTRFKKKVYILVDEFDKPVLPLFKKLILEKDQQKIDEIKQTIKQTVKTISDVVGEGAEGSDCIQKIILTGILNIVDKDSSSLLNGIKDVNLMDDFMIDYIGFSEEEVKNQILAPIIKQDDNFYHLYKQLEFWYKGYNYGKKIGLFNPFSVMSFLQDFVYNNNPDFKPFWSNSSSNTLLSGIIKSQNLTEGFKTNLLILLKGQQNASLNLDDQMIRKQLYDVLMDSDRNDESKFDELTFQLLVKFGYLTLSQGKYVIPGYEIKYIFLEKFLPAFIREKQLSVDLKKVYEILEGDPQQFMAFIQTKLLRVIKPGQYTEHDFQALMFCLFYGNMIVQEMPYNTIQQYYDAFLEQNVDQGGLIDTIFYPLETENNNKSIQIHEYKIKVRNSRIPELSCNVLWQIIIGKYAYNAIQQKNAKQAKWRGIVLKGITFYADANNLWHIHVEQLELTFQQAHQIETWISLQITGAIKKLNYEQKKDHLLKKHKKKDFKDLISFILKTDIKTKNYNIQISDQNQENKKKQSKKTKNNIDDQVDKDKQDVTHVSVNKQKLTDLFDEEGINKKAQKKLTGKIQKYTDLISIRDTLFELKRDDMNDDFRGFGEKGLDALANKIFQTIFGTQSKFKKGISDDRTKQDNHFMYTSQQLDLILRKRINEENLDGNITQLSTHKSYEYSNINEGMQALLQKVQNSFQYNKHRAVIVPYAEEEHFFGLIFKLQEGRVIADYLDSENQEIKEEFKERITGINKIKVAEQIFSDNCGIELIENIIGYLKEEDLTCRSINQNEAIEIHKKLSCDLQKNKTFKEELSDIKFKDVKFEDASNHNAQKLQQTIGMIEELKTKKRNKKRIYKGLEQTPEAQDFLSDVFNKKLLLFNSNQIQSIDV